MSAPLYVALVHFPIRARDGSTITTAVTNVDVHDIARSARTFGCAGYFVVTPIAAQRQIVARILEHWHEGEGKERIPERGMALARVTAVPLLADAVTDIAGRHGTSPTVIVTSAADEPGCTSFEAMRARLEGETAPHLLVFGTGHGLANSVLDGADLRLAPVFGVDGYNHLSVRAAAAIILDRLRGR